MQKYRAIFLVLNLLKNKMLNVVLSKETAKIVVE